MRVVKYFDVNSNLVATLVDSAVPTYDWIVWLGETEYEVSNIEFFPLLSGGTVHVTLLAV